MGATKGGQKVSKWADILLLLTGGLVQGSQKKDVPKISVGGGVCTAR